MQGKFTRKAMTILKVVDHIIEIYKPQDGMIVLMWRETINGFHGKQSEGLPLWDRDSKAVHEHWKIYGPGVIHELRGKYRLTVVTINSNIREHLKHAEKPHFLGKVRTDQWYRSCVSGPNRLTMGIALFPRDTSSDHPLVVEYLKKRSKSASTGFENAVVAVNTANDLENLTDDSRDEIKGNMRTVAERAIEDKYPLFPNRRVEGDKQPALNPPVENVDPDEEV